MKRTHYTVKAQRARIAWERLKEQTPKTTDHGHLTAKNTIERKLPEMVH